MSKRTITGDTEEIIKVDAGQNEKTHRRVLLASGGVLGWAQHVLGSLLCKKLDGGATDFLLFAKPA